MISEEIIQKLIALRSELPENISSSWIYEAIRHYQRNCEWDEPTDGEPLNRYDGQTLADIVSFIPYVKKEIKND